MKIAQIGLGLWKVRDQAEVDTAIGAAVKASYRLFDSAQAYGNEQYIPSALKKAGLSRAEAFITTKIATHNFARVKSSFAESLSKLESDYVDLLLLHFPVTLLRHHAWRALEDIYNAGQAKSIGVSNYTIRHLEHLLKDCQVKPAVNQVELHVYLQQPELLAYCRENDIVVEAYSPLAQGQFMDNPVLAEIGKKYSKSPAQIMIRWCIDQNAIPLPKSVNPTRIAENIDVFDFKLDGEDLQKLKSLDQNLRTCWDPTRIP